LEDNKEEYDDIHYLLTIIGFSIYKSYYVSNQRGETCDIINILVREIKFILQYEYAFLLPRARV
jgi:hypothetical protein